MRAAHHSRRAGGEASSWHGRQYRAQGPLPPRVEQSVRKLEYDLFYVKNHTLALDIMIMLETVRVVLLGEGAH